MHENAGLDFIYGKKKRMNEFDNRLKVTKKKEGISAFKMESP